MATVYSDSGAAGGAENRSFQRRSSITPSGTATNSTFYKDEDDKVGVHAPAGSYFKIYANGAIELAPISDLGIQSRAGGPGDKNVWETADIGSSVGDLKSVRDENGNVVPGGSSTSKMDGGSTFSPSSLTMAYKDSASYKALPDSMKALVDTSFATLAVGTEEDFKKLDNAIKQAQGIVDPFFAAQLALTRASFVDQIAKQTQDYEFGAAATKRIRDELMQDIGNSLDKLGLEEQSTIAKIVRQFDQTSLDLKDQAASKGTTFGSGRFSLSSDINTASIESADLLQSARRSANFERQSLQLKAERGETLTNEELAKLEATKSYNLQSIVRNAESIMGTKNTTDLAASAPEVAGTNIVGGVMGSAEEQRQKSFSEELKTWYNAQKPTYNLG